MTTALSSTRIRIVVASFLVVALAAVALVRRGGGVAPADAVPVAATDGPTSSPADDESIPDSPLALAVAEDLAPARDAVASLPGEEPRPVGRLGDASGVPMDVVLGELVVTYRDPVELESFLTAVDGEVVDRFDDDGEEVRDALVRFATVPDDREVLAARMVELEPDLAGDWQVSDEGVLDVLAAVAVADEHGLQAMPNSLHEPTGILSGTTSDGNGPYGDDAFTYPYIQSGRAQDIGLDRAWRLLADTDHLDRTVRIMVHDQGFRLNDDSPDARWIEDASWGEQASSSYGAAWHGAMVANAAMGKVDNGFGGAGPAGPTYAQLVAVGDAGSSWSTIRRLVDLVDEYRPDVLNMSWSGSKTTARLAHQDFFERKFAKIKQMGTLSFASAGNDNRDIDAKACGGCIERRIVLPCEARGVVCVGGMGEDTTARAVGGCSAGAPGSNFGTRTGSRSVEIWGPYFVSGQSGTSGNPGRLCGTSFASPFVAGVAGLLHAADGDLSPDEIWDIMKQTANDGGVGAEVSGHQRRIDAGAAVQLAIGGIFLPPQLELTSPDDGDEYTLGDFVDFDASANDHQGRTLDVTFESDLDGVLGTTKVGLGSDSLSEGTHVITATASDNLGASTSETVTITLVDQPTTIKVHSPTPGEDTWFGQSIFLAGSAEDDDLLGYAVPSEDLSWMVVRPTNLQQPLFLATGSSAEVPANTLPPGTYIAKLTATVDGHSTSKQVPFFVKVAPTGAVPTAVIDEPADGQTFGYQNGSGKLIHFEGHATDVEDGALSGTRLRWTATHKADDGTITEVALCTGSDVPGGADEPEDEPKEPGLWLEGNGSDDDSSPQLTAIVDCSDFDAELSLNGEVGAAEWTILLEAFDTSGGPPGPDKAVIGIHHAVG